MEYFVPLVLFLCLFCNPVFGYSQNSEALLVDGPSYLAVELTQPLTFNITWRSEGGVELELSRTFINASKLLSINETSFKLFGDWKNQAKIDIGTSGNDSIISARTNNNLRTIDTTTVTVDLGRARVEYEGTFAITVTNRSLEEDNVSETAYFRIVTYAFPTLLDLALNADSGRYDEGAHIAIFTCSGNAGRPFGILRLSRSAMNSSECFSHFDSVDALMVLSRKRANGTYWFSYNFNVSMRSDDDGRYFRCDVISDVPTHKVFSSDAKQVFVACK